MLISVVNGKGGTSKTTTAVYLAVALGWPVVDLDPQRSATEWAERAGDGLEVYPAGKRDLGRLRGDAVIDTPPGSPQVIDAAIEVSDFIVVPTRASGIEVARVWDTLPSLEGKPYRVLIVGARPGTKSLTSLMKVLDDEKIPRFETVIPLREAISTSFGTVPTQLHGYDEVADEIKKEGN